MQTGHSAQTLQTAPPPPLSANDALFLDFDGTLAELAPRPDAVHADPELAEQLILLQDLLGGALAIITGRPLREIDAYLRPAAMPGAGLHGAELRPAPRAPVRRRASGSVPALAATLRSRYGADARLLVEDKGAAVALHFRQAPERAEELAGAMRELAGVHALEVIHGKAVVEARLPGADKGAAILSLMQPAPFAGRRPVFLGDDLTDEAGFAAVNRAGGVSVKVGAGESRARYRLSGVPAVHAWLQAGIRRLQAGEGGAWA